MPKKGFQLSNSGNGGKGKVVKTGEKLDVITEMASLAKNQILYNAYANRVSKIYSDLKWVIENSGR